MHVEAINAPCAAAPRRFAANPLPPLLWQRPPALRVWITPSTQSALNNIPVMRSLCGFVSFLTAPRDSQPWRSLRKLNDPNSKNPAEIAAQGSVGF